MSKADIVIKDGQEYVETDYSDLLGLGLNVPKYRTLACDTLASSRPLMDYDDIKKLVQSDDWEFGQKYFDSSFITYQNGYGSCAGYAIAGAGTKSMTFNGFPRVDLSGDYQYSMVNDGRDRGSGLQENMESFMQNGCATAKTVKLGDIYRNRYDTRKADAEATRFKGHELFAIPDERSLFTALALKMQVIIAIHVTRNWRKFDRNDVLAECNGPGNHCEHLDDVRYNLTAGRLEARKATSHGVDYSGDGYCWTAWDLHYATSSRYHTFYAIGSMKVDPLLDLDDRDNEDSTPSPQPSDNLEITCYTRDNCGWCTKWKNEVAPKAKKDGWKIEYVGNSQGSVPRFEINVKGNVINRTGFISYQELRNLNTVR